jgi:sensor c-di-GMP phosphodiesterase-like protein
MKNLILLMGFGLIMSLVMVRVLLEYRRRQQQSRFQPVMRPRHNMGYLSQPVVHG